MGSRQQAQRPLLVRLEPRTRINAPGRVRASSAVLVLSRFPDLQPVARAQRASQWPQPGIHVQAAAAQHRFENKAAVHCEIDPATLANCTQSQHRILANETGRPHRDRSSIHARIEGRAGKRDPRVGVEFQGRAQQGDFQHAGIGRVAGQCVGETARRQVECAGMAHPQMRVADPAEILGRRQQPGLENLDSHGTAAPRAMKSPASMLRKRTRSPGASRHGGSRRASNTLSGVRPISIHPPGNSRG